MILKNLKYNKTIVITILLFGIIYSLISFVNHYNFRTYALDLGFYTNAMFKYANFQLADSNMIKEFYEPILGGHFDLYLILFSPLIYLFGTYTLLIIQITALIIGGIGIYNYFKLIYSKDKTLPIVATIYFYSFFGVFGAISYDYHSVVVASSIIPWLFVFIHKNKKILSVILLGFILVSQENMSLLMAFIFLGLLLEYRTDYGGKTNLLLFFGISIFYFITVIYLIIPFFSAENIYGGFMYTFLGNNPLEAINTLFTHPIDSLKILFINHNTGIHGDYVKTELHIILLASGLPLLIKKPQYILMLIPIYFQKLYHDNFLMWGIGSQYNIEFAPIMTIGIFKVISEFKNKKVRICLTYTILFFVLTSSFRTMDSTILYTDKSRIRFYQKRHYERNYDVKQVHLQLLKIPKNAIVSAQSPFIPHLALREKIYQFPIIKDADFIIFSRKEDLYPIKDIQTFNKLISKLEKSMIWVIKYSDDDITILEKRIKPIK